MVDLEAEKSEYRGVAAAMVIVGLKQPTPFNTMPFNEVHFHVGESLQDSQIAEILLRSPSRRDGATCFIERDCRLAGVNTCQ